MNNKNNLNKWLPFLFWFGISFIFLTVPQFKAICLLHERGHYLSGEMLGCKGLVISCPINAEIQEVSGWESCFSDNLGHTGLAVCSIKTAFVNLSGLMFSLIILISFIFLINFILKRTLKRYYLEGKFLLLELAFIIVWGLRSSSIDFKNLLGCYNPQTGIIVYNLFSLLPYLFILIIILWCICDCLSYQKSDKLPKRRHHNDKS